MDIPPHDYICIDRPMFDKRNDPKAKSTDKPKDSLWKKPASEHPEWPWVMMWQSWTIRCDWNRFMTYRDPDNFGMYIYNDWFGYGIQELQENLVCSLWAPRGNEWLMPMFDAASRFQQGV